MNKILNKVGKFMLAALVVGSGVVAAANMPTFARSADCSVDGGVTSGVNCAKGKDTPTTLFGNGGIFAQVVNVLLFIVGVLSVIMIIFSGIRYVTSNGDSQKTKSATNGLIWSIAGLAVAILAYAIVNFVLKNILKQDTGN